MCGIIGAYGPYHEDLDPALRAMVHRGPDGTHIKRLHNTTLGHTRLAIIDLEGGDQPISTPDGQRWVICNGEFYNFPQLRPHFPDYPYQTYSDTEIILPLYERYGVDAVRHLDGMFAFALIAEDDILLARDPLGIKPLYYGWSGETLLFASEIKSIQGRVDAVLEFPPGHFYSGKTGMVRYYDVAHVGATAPLRYEGHASIGDIRDSLTQAVRKRLMSDVPLGVYLSGGLDSTIVASLVAQDMGNVHSFSVGVATSQDLEYARRAAKAIGTQHHEYVYTEREMLEALPDIIYHLESFDPTLVRSAIPNYFLSRLTAEHVTVVLMGEGADELYAGYHYLKDVPDEALQDELVHLTGELYSCNLRRADRMTMAHSLEGRVPFLDTDFIATSFAVPNAQKIYGEQKIEKWALRKAFEGVIPDEVTWRIKSQFAEGAGSISFMEAHAEQTISDETFLSERASIHAEHGYDIRNKEELLYYRHYADHFDHTTAALVKPWRGHYAEGGNV